MKKTILLTGSESFVAHFLIKKLKKKYNIIGIDTYKKTKNTNLIIDLRKTFFNKLKNWKNLSQRQFQALMGELEAYGEIYIKIKKPNSINLN